MSTAAQPVLKAQVPPSIAASAVPVPAGSPSQGNGLVMAPSAKPQSLTSLATANVCGSVSTKDLQATVSNSSGLVITMLPSAISAILVVVGWFVVHKAQSNRERRKQIREYVAKLCEDLAALEKLAIEYHTAMRDEAKELELQSKLGRFDKSCTNLPQFINSQKYFKAVRPEKLKLNAQRLKELRQAITLNHFGEGHTAEVRHQGEFILNLMLASEEVMEDLACVLRNALD